MRHKTTHAVMIAGRDEIVLEMMDTSELLNLFDAARRAGERGVASDVVIELIRRGDIDPETPPLLRHGVPVGGWLGLILGVFWHQKRIK